MPSRMPEFEMPPEPPARGDAPASDIEAAAPDADASAPSQPALDDGRREALAAARRRLLAGVILAALLVVGGSTAAIVQAVQRQAEAADTAALTDLALDYLAAIADGRGDDATALVPVDGDAALLTDAALSAADRPRQVEVAAVELDGDAATVLVELSGGPGRIERRLAAMRDEGGWRLTTSLAERVVVLDEERAVGQLPRLLGVEVGGEGGTLLYPGVYRTEPITEGLVSVEASTIRVDGDPATPAEPTPPAWRAADGLVEEARRLALAHGVACQAAAACPAPEGALLGLGDTVQLQVAEGGAIELEVPLRVLTDGGGASAELQVGVRATALDGGVDWACAVRQTRVGATATPEAELPPDWQPCG